jgi:hypothetical protein
MQNAFGMAAGRKNGASLRALRSRAADGIRRSLVHFRTRLRID